jgi:hypothetical protein
VRKLASDLKELLDSLEPVPRKTTMVIFNMMDKSYFQARGEDGLFIPHRQHDGKYHVDGNLVDCPLETVKLHFEMMLPIFEAAAEATRLFMVPILRYLYSGCCSDVDHAPNRSKEKFIDNMLDGLKRTKKTLRSPAFRHGLKAMKIINPSRSLVEPSLWDSDPVHPSSGAYKILLDYIVKALEAANSTTSISEVTPAKRPAEAQMTGPSRRPHWISTVPGNSAAEWTSCRGTSLGGGQGRGRGCSWERGGGRRGRY